MKVIDAYNIMTDLPVGTDYITVRSYVEAVNAVVPLTVYNHYDSVVWASSPGTARYKPLPGSNPTHGAINEFVETETIMIELNIPHDDEKLEKLLAVMIEHHPWEEPYIKITKAKVTISQE